MKKSLLFFSVLYFLIVSDIYSQNGWFLQQSVTWYSLKDVYFINTLTGWAVGDSGVIIKTTNGGTNWNFQNSNTTYNLTAVKFYSDLSGWVTGGIRVFVNPYIIENGIVLKTTDGGSNWIINIQTNNQAIFRDVSIIDPNNLYVAIGGADWNSGFSTGQIGKTTNGGTNWIVCISGPFGNTAFHSVNFLNQNTGWASSIFTTDVIPSCKSIMFKTTNQGVNWVYFVVDSGYGMSEQEFQKIRFSDASTGYFLQRYFRKTTNGGNSWIKIDSAATTGGKSFHFVNKDTGWFISSNGGIKRTNNGGLNWINQNSTVTGFLNIYFVNNQTGWAVGNNGAIIKTTTGGIADTITPKFFPLAVGNVFVYNWIYSGSGSGVFRIKILRDSIILGKRYFLTTYGFPTVTNASNLYRFDSLSGNLYCYIGSGGCFYNSTERLIDSLKAKKYDSAKTCSVFDRKCYDTSASTIFGISTPSKNFDNLILLTGNGRKYGKNFGVIYAVEGDPDITIYNLKGCVINGIVYGDTTAPPDVYSISGSVKYADNNQPVTSGTVKAFKLNKTDGNIMYLDSAQIQPNGNYILNNIPQDSLDIGVFPNSTPPNDYVITYYPSTIYWQNATILYPTGNLTNINIFAYRLVNTSASNSVNGKVTRLTDVTIGNLKDAFLYARNGNTFVRCTISDISGVYHLQSLPSGNLKIIVNRLGFTGDSTSVNVTSTSNIDSINYRLYRLYTGIKQIIGIVPSEYKLFQNYPNPFNPVTFIKYSIPMRSPTKAFGDDNVMLKVYDILGKEVATLVNEKQSPGTYAVSWDALQYPTGVYFYKLITENFTNVKRMILIK